MTFRVEVVCVGDDGEEHRRDVAAMKRHQLTMDTLGLTLRESQALLAGVQDFVVTQQAAMDLKQRRRCQRCGERHTVKSTYSNSGLVWLISHTAAGQKVLGPCPWHGHRCQRGFATCTAPNNVFTSVAPPPQPSGRR